MSDVLSAMLESPLHAFDLPTRTAVPSSHNRLMMSELGNLGYLILRGVASDQPFMQAVAGVLGHVLPTQPMTVLSTSSGTVLWVSPDEWLLVCRRSAKSRLLATLTDALQDVFSQVVDNSGGLTALRVAGPDHMLLLRHLGPYDYESLPVGRCASTVASKTGFTVVRTDEAGVVIVFRRSFADYTWRLIERTARPYQPCITSPAECVDPMFFPLFEIA